LSTTPVRLSRTRQRCQQLSNRHSASEGSINVARPSAAAGFPASKVLGDVIISSSAVDDPSLTSQPRSASAETSNVAADERDAQSRVQSASYIAVEVETDINSRATDVVHRRRRKKGKKKKSLVTDDEQQQQQQQQQQQAFSSEEL